MEKIMLNIYKLNKNLNLLFMKKNNILILKNFLGIKILFLPSYYFYLNNKNLISFIFLNKFFFKSFIAHFFYNYLNLNYIYIVRLKIRGLGYQIVQLSSNLISFHFQHLNFFYFFLPNNILVK